MGVFSDNVRRYFEHGLVTIPCKDKRPVLGKEWQKFCEEIPTEKQIDQWESQFKDINQLGLPLGKSTKLCGFDFDYEYNPSKVAISEKDFEKDKKLIERQLLAILPPSPCVKTGKKGWTRFYRIMGDLENTSCDRNGVRLFDFLARNKQTIIPPSKYSDDTDLVYRWQGVPIEDCMDDIPYINQGVIDEIKLLLGERVDDNSRHGKLFRWAIRELILEPDINLVAKRLIEYDKAVNETPYLSDKKHHPKPDAESNALYWLKRIAKWKDSKPKKGEYEFLQAIKSSREMYFQFFEKILGTHKVDLISDRLMVDVETKTEYGTSTRRWRPAANMISKLRSDAREKGLPHMAVEDHLSAYKESLVPGLLLEIPEWDGKDRLAEICKITCPTNVPSVEIYTDIMKDIASGIFRRTFDSMEQNLCTIIRGNQGAGKNYFIESVFAKPFGHYSAEVNVGNDQAKNYDAVEGRLVCVIGEFDQTQKVQLSFVKELITNASFTARRAYERTSERYELRQTFFSASNFSNVLKDSSGNRRYVIWDMPTIDWRYSEFCDADQLRAQYFHLYKSKYRMSSESKAWLTKFNAEETPDDPLDLAIEQYVAENKKMTAPIYEQGVLMSRSAAEIRSKEWLSGAEVNDIISAACRQFNVPEVRLRQELKRRGMSKRSNGTWFKNLSKDAQPVQNGQVLDKDRAF